MKKIFTLLTLLLCAVTSSWADTELFYLEVKSSGSDVNVNRNGGTLELNTTTHLAYLRYGSATIKNNKSGDGTSKMLGSDNSEYHIRYSDNAHVLIISLDNALAKDDVISFTGSANKQLCFTTSESRSTAISTTSKSYTIPESSPLIGATTIYVWRESGDNTFIKSFTITRPAATGPTITTQPQSASYVTGYAAASMQVVATASAGDLSYQWYRCDDTEKNNSHAISGATAASYVPSTENAGTFYYYCVVTDSNGDTASNVVTITVSAAAAPSVTISADPEGEIATGATVTLTATITAGNPTPTLQWYSNTTNATAGAQSIAGATNATYTPDTSSPGTKYYFAVGHNTEGDNPSNILAVVVKDKVATPTFTPNGAYFDGASQSVTIACGTDDATIQYSTDNGNTWNNYSAAINVTETTTIKAKATKEGYITSDEASATFTKVTLTPQADVTAATTWDWSDVSNSSAVDFSGTVLNNQDVLFANISAYGLTAVTGLANQSALLMNGQRAYNNANGSKHCQVNYLKFNTTVKGKVTVEYANTGGNAARTVNVNGTKGSESSTANNSYQTEIFPVAIGEVTIKGVQVSDDADKMLRIRKVVFTPLGAGEGDIVKVTDANYATIVLADNIDFDATNGVTAYTANVNGDQIELTEVHSAPAGTPLIIAATSKTYLLTHSSSPAAVGANDLTAGDVTGDGASHYVLGKDSSDKLGFGLLANGVYLPATKAYIPATKFAGAREFYEIDLGGGVTAIKNIKVGAEDNIYYDLNGRRVLYPTKGLYIVNGKKVIMK